jgi:hypothetical protein
MAYTTVELMRQIIQVRLGEITSEEARGAAWDQHGYWRMDEHKSQISEMYHILKTAAPSPEHISPLLAEIVHDTHSLLASLQPLKIKAPKKQKEDLTMSF